MKYPKKSLLRRNLFVRRFFPNMVLSLINFCYSFRRKKKIFDLPPPKKILLCNIANFGDVVISTTVFPVIKKKFPDCEIGFLAASAVGKIVLENHPLIARVHQLDHWALNSICKNRCKAFLRYLIQKRQVRKEIKTCRYDVAIDLYSYFPNAIPLLAQCQIPIRIGYPTGGFSNLLTHSMKWDFSNRYIGYAHLHLLQALGIDTQNESPLPFYQFKNTQSNHVVVHMGASYILKEWRSDCWVQLVQKLEKLGHKIYLTGKGTGERKLCDWVSSQTSAVNLCDQLSWSDFVSAIQEASLLITVDSVPVHIAAGSLTPTLVLCSGINLPAMWTPPSFSCKALIHPVACCPCLNKKGCASMRCIQEISVDEVFREAVMILVKSTSEFYQSIR